MTDMNEEQRKQYEALNALAARARKTAVEHGFENASFGEEIALVHSELSEALEDFRESKPIDALGFELTSSGPKPVGIPSELADVLIRIFDMCGKYGIDIGGAVIAKMKYNDGRPFRHGGKTL